MPTNSEINSMGILKRLENNTSVWRSFYKKIILSYNLIWDAMDVNCSSSVVKILETL